MVIGSSYILRDIYGTSRIAKTTQWTDNIVTEVTDCIVIEINVSDK